jgi:protein-S-isoprenylcysteine O-methyltransferase Ste14
MTPTAGIQDPVFLEKLRRIYKTTTILAGGMVGGLAVYLLLAEIIRAQKRPFLGYLNATLSGDSRMTIRYAVYGAAVAIVLLLRLINGRQMRSLGNLSPEAGLARLQRAGILALVLAEIPSLLGLALFLAAGYNRDFYVLLFVSLFLFFMYFPRLKNWEDILQKNRSSCRF